MSRYRGFQERNKNFSTKFKLQLMITFICTYTVILLVGCFLFYRSTVEVIRERSKQDIYQQLQQLEHNLLLLTDEVEAMAQAMTISNSIGRILNDYFVSDSERVTVIRELFGSMSTVMFSYKYVDSIYIYGSKGIVFGGQENSRRYAENMVEAEKFYDSNIYHTIMQEDKVIVWSGGYTGSDFAFCSEGKENKNYITFAKKLFFIGQQPAVLIINVDEEYFRNMYSRVDGELVHERYLVDEEGKIISHADKNRIGKRSRYFQNLKDAMWQSYMVTEEMGAKVQVIGQKLPNQNWVILDETKISYLEKDAQHIKRLMVLIVCIGVIASWGSAAFWIHKITRPLNCLNQMMRKTESGVFGLELDARTTTQLGILGTQFNAMSVGIQNLMDKNQKIEEEKRNYEIQTLWSQINPHFIYNTLNVIKWMAMIAKADNITKCVIALGNILQPVFQRKGDFWSLKEELEYIDSYILIMNYRYGNTIRFTKEIPQRYCEQEILKFVLQPIIENCIVHGNVADAHRIHITIGLQKTGEVLKLTVSDNGVGIEEGQLYELQNKLQNRWLGDEMKEHHGIGILNVNLRLLLYYGEGNGLTISNNPNGGVKVVIRIPENREKVPKS